jgi:hypothetical protein
LRDANADAQYRYHSGVLGLDATERGASTEGQTQIEATAPKELTVRRAC